MGKTPHLFQNRAREFRATDSQKNIEMQLAVLCKLKNLPEGESLSEDERKIIREALNLPKENIFEDGEIKHLINLFFEPEFKAMLEPAEDTDIPLGRPWDRLIRPVFRLIGKAESTLSCLDYVSE
ncbi:MAG: hypothetical protein ACFFAE_15285 [Candidatus Hodarchaeota archaeon]